MFGLNEVATAQRCQPPTKNAGPTHVVGLVQVLRECASTYIFKFREAFIDRIMKGESFCLMTGFKRQISCLREGAVSRISFESCDSDSAYSAIRYLVHKRKEIHLNTLILWFFFFFFFSSFPDNYRRCVLVLSLAGASAEKVHHSRACAAFTSNVKRLRVRDRNAINLNSLVACTQSLADPLHLEGLI